jgi:hypothetical protein
MGTNKRAPWRRLSGGVLLLLATAAAGCGSGTVRGKVSYKGQALGGGTVVFTVPGKGSVRAEIGEDGTYTASNCPPGRAKLTVETASAQPAGIRDPRAGPSAGMRPPPGAVPEGADASFYQAIPKKGKYVAIPAKYNDPDKSGLEYTVHSGSQGFNIDLP